MKIDGWLRRWEAGGICGLGDKQEDGGKANPARALDLPQIKRQVQENARRLKIARQKLKEASGREFSGKTSKRI